MLHFPTTFAHGAGRGRVVMWSFYVSSLAENKELWGSRILVNPKVEEAWVPVSLCGRLPTEQWIVLYLSQKFLWLC